MYRYSTIAHRIVAKLDVPKDKVISFSHEPFKNASVELKNRRFKDGFKTLSEGLAHIVTMLRALDVYADNTQAEMGLGVGKNTKKHIDTSILKLSEAIDAINEMSSNLGDAR